MEKLPLEERQAMLEKVKTLEGAVSSAQLSQLSADILAKQHRVLLTGELKQVPLPQALRFVTEGAKSVSVVFQANGELNGLRVSAIFQRATARHAVASLLRLYPEYLEWDEEGGVFSVRARPGGSVTREPEIVPIEVEVVQPKLSLAELRKLASEGEHAAARWEASKQQDQAAYNEAVEKLDRALDRMMDRLYDAKGPYVDPKDPDFLKQKYSGYEAELQQWAQLLHDLHKRGHVR